VPQFFGRRWRASIASTKKYRLALRYDHDATIANASLLADEEHICYAQAARLFVMPQVQDACGRTNRCLLLPSSGKSNRISPAGNKQLFVALHLRSCITALDNPYVMTGQMHNPQ
jgi:hypothetical protein